MQTTPRLGLQYPSPTDVESTYPGVAAQLATTLDQAAIDLQGTLNGRPPAGLTGRYYWATDTQELYRDTGTAWVQITPSSVQPAHSWTWDDQSGPNPSASILGSLFCQPANGETQTLIGCWHHAVTPGSPATSFALLSATGGTPTVIGGLGSITPTSTPQFVSPSAGPLALTSGQRISLQLVTPGASLGVTVTAIISHVA